MPANSIASVAVPAVIGAAGVMIIRSVASSSVQVGIAPPTVHVAIASSAALSTSCSVACATSSWMTTVPSNVASSNDGRSREVVPDGSRHGGEAVRVELERRLV